MSFSTFERPLYRTSSEDITNRRLVDQFTKLFPSTKGQRTVDPAHSGMMGAICNLAKSAFDANRYPEVSGLDEQTTSLSTIKHLTRDSFFDTMEGIFRIDVDNAQHLKNLEWEAGERCDPYVVFKHGGSVVKSATIYGTVSPVWNSTHYLCVRKRHLERKADTTLTAVVLCRETHKMNDSITDAISNHDHFGVGSVSLDECKQPGVHEFEIELKHPTLNRDNTATLSFKVEFISLEDALEEMKQEETSKLWMEPLTAAERSQPWCQLACMTEVGDIELTQVAHISSASKLTRAWIEVNRDLKMVVVSFSRVDYEDLPGMLGDDYQPEPLKLVMQSQWEYIVKPRKSLRNAGIRLHGGFKAAYDSIRESVLRVVYDITEWSADWTICVTGHSTGGALATICAFDFGNRRLKTAAESPMSYMAAAKDRFHRIDHAIKPQLAMISFGAPRVGNGVFTRLYDLSISQSLRVVNVQDPIPHLPLHYIHTRTEVEFTTNGEVKIPIKSSESKEKSENALKDLGITHTPYKKITPRGTPVPYGSVPEEDGGHLKYFETTQKAVKKTFWQDVEERGHPIRILRS